MTSTLGRVVGDREVLRAEERLQRGLHAGGVDDEVERVGVALPARARVACPLAAWTKIDLNLRHGRHVEARSASSR